MRPCTHAGDSDLDQIYRIQQVLGPMTPEQDAMFRANPHNVGIVFNIKQPLTLATRYASKMGEVSGHSCEHSIVLQHACTRARCARRRARCGASCAHTCTQRRPTNPAMHARTRPHPPTCVPGPGVTPGL